jgi:uncharacterized membrane protein YjgN (DUF898 family)
MIITRKHIASFIFLAIFSIIQLVSIASFAHPVLADDALFNSQIGVNEIGSVYGNQKTDIRVVVVNIIQIVLGFLAIIFLVLIVFAGFRYMTAAGNEDQTKKAVAQIRDAAIGLFIVLASWTITIYIIRYISRSVNNNINLGI